MVIDEESLANILYREASSRGGQKAAAKRLGVSAQYLCDVLHGRRAMGAALLRGLGYKRVIMYERLSLKPGKR